MLKIIPPNDFNDIIYGGITGYRLEFGSREFIYHKTRGIDYPCIDKLIVTHHIGGYLYQDITYQTFNLLENYDTINLDKFFKTTLSGFEGIDRVCDGITFKMSSIEEYGKIC